MPKKDQIKINFRLQAGFTLIEMIVAMAIFGVLAVSITGIFISVIKSQRLALAQNSIQESGRYILESMTKEIRMSQEITELGVSSALHLINSDRKDVFEFANNYCHKKLIILWINLCSREKIISNKKEQPPYF